MSNRTTTLSEGEEAAFREYKADFRRRINEQLGQILSSIELEGVRTQVQSIAFTANDALPKRKRRPKIEIAILGEQIYRSHDPDGSNADELLQFTLLVEEYYDIVDDIIDGDVAAGKEAEVFVTNQLLQPLVVRHLAPLGDDAVQYWSEHALRMVTCFARELTETCCAENYLEIVDRQSELFGTITGLAAIVAGESEETVSQAEEFGKTYFKFDQFMLDGEQYRDGDPDPWNAWNLLSEADAVKHLRSWQAEMNEYLDQLPTERATRIRPLVAIDIETWHDSITAESEPKR